MRATNLSELALETARWRTTIVDALRSAGPLLLFGLRVWASTCLALYIAFWLELDNAFWAGTTAALVCQPHLGASLRKGWFRMIGTLVGAVAMVQLTAMFPQNRDAFLLSLALWGGACAFVASLLQNFAAYAASLAGYTAALIANDQLGATGGPNGLAFTLAITRTSEIWIGIVCAGIVLAGTDFGAAPRRLAARLTALSAEILNRFHSTLALAGTAFSDTQPVRRELLRQVIALDPAIDEAIGESSTIRYHSPVLWAAVDGLLAALTSWRIVGVRLSRLPDESARQEAGAVLRTVPAELHVVAQQTETAPWTADPIGARSRFSEAVRTLIGLPATTPSLRLIADETTELLTGFCRVLDGLALLVGDPRARVPGRRRLHVADWLPGLVNAGRAFVTIGAAEIFWVLTEWPSGTLAFTFTAITVILLAPTANLAYERAVSFTIGTGFAAVGAAFVLLAGLPKVDTFAGFSAMLGLFLIPVAALSAQPWQQGMFVAMAYNFIPMIAPANEMSYDSVQFYNTAFAIVAGSGLGALSFRLLPPLSPAFRTYRLQAMTLRDLRRLAREPLSRRAADWETRMYSRLVAMPDQAEPLQRGELTAALTVGSATIALRGMATRLGFEPELELALAALAQGDTSAATERLAALDHRLAAGADRETELALQARGRMLAIADALAQHREYFDQGAPG